MFGGRGMWKQVEAAMWIEAGDSESGKACWEVYYNNGETAEFDQIWLATGTFPLFSSARSLGSQH